MLNLMRKHARSWIMKFILGIIIVVFVLYFGSMSGRQKAETVAKIDGKIITVADVGREYENLVNSYQRLYGTDLSPEVIKKLNLKQKALDNLVDRAIILRKADEYKIRTSDDEVKAFIMTTPSFQINGAFDARAYDYALRSIKMSPEEFEDLQKKMLTAAKLEDLISEAAKISDKELFDLYKFQTQKLNIEYLKLSPKNFAAKVKMTNSQLEEYYKTHSEKFRVPDQVKIKYLEFAGRDYMQQVNVPSDDVKNYYDSHKSQFQKAGKTLPLSEVESKIITELKRIGGMYKASDSAKKAHDTVYQQENFDAYAQQNGIKTQTTSFFTAKNPPAEFKSVTDFANIVFGLEKNEISRVISTDDGYYVFTLADKKPAFTPPFKEIEKEIKERYVEDESQKLCAKAAQEIADKLKKGDSFRKLSDENHVKISETGFFLPAGAVPQIGYSQELSEALLQLSLKNPYAGPFSIGGQYVVVRLKEYGPVDENDFLAKKDLLKKQFVRVKKMELIRSWIDGNKAAMIKDGLLDIKRDVKDF